MIPVLNSPACMCTAENHFKTQKQIALSESVLAETAKENYWLIEKKIISLSHIIFCKSVEIEIFKRSKNVYNGWEIGVSNAVNERAACLQEKTELEDFKQEEDMSHSFALQKMQYADLIAEIISEYFSYMGKIEGILFKACEISKNPNEQNKYEFRKLATEAAETAVLSFNKYSALVANKTMLSRDAIETIENTLEMAASVAELLGKNCY